MSTIEAKYIALRYRAQEVLQLMGLANELMLKNLIPKITLLRDNKLNIELTMTMAS